MPNQEVSVLAERHVRLFRNGRNQAIRIPREFELGGMKRLFAAKVIV